MENIGKELGALLKGKAVDVNTGDYMGADGFIHCGTCDEAKEVMQPVGIQGRTIKRRRDCACERAEREEKERQEREAENLRRVERAKRDCFKHIAMHSMTFANDDGRNAEASKAIAKYSKQFDRFKAIGGGLMLWGPVGTGKSYMAAAVANDVIENGGTAIFTNLVDVGNAMNADFGRNRDAVIAKLTSHDLVILDDLGVERTTPTMNESVYQVINTLYMANTVMLFTTNLTLESIVSDQEPSRERIYSRIMERCMPVEIKGKDRRQEQSKKRRALYEEVMGI